MTDASRSFASRLFNGRDLLASVVVFLVALPLCMGIALASGVPPALGLITGIVGGLVIGSLAGSPLQVSGPAAGLAVIVWDLVHAYGLAALGAAVLVAGLLQAAAGFAGMGRWFRAVSPAVIQGMLAGIGVLIFASQFHVDGGRQAPEFGADQPDHDPTGGDQGRRPVERHPSPPRGADRAADDHHDRVLGQVQAQEAQDGPRRLAGDHRGVGHRGGAELQHQARRRAEQPAGARSTSRRRSRSPSFCKVALSWRPSPWR